MNNNKIKEAFDKWIENEMTKEERDFVKDSLSLMSMSKMLGFHGGYTSRDEEVEQLKKENAALRELLGEVKDTAREARF